MTTDLTNRPTGGPGAMRAQLLSSGMMLRGPNIAFAPDDGPATLESVLEERRTREPSGLNEGAEPDDLGGDDDADAGGEAQIDPDAEPADGEQDREPAGDAIEAPNYWTAEAKAKFADLPPELQAIVVEQEAGRETHVQKTQQSAVEARKAADREAEGLKELSTRVNGVVDLAQKQFKRVIPELGMAWDEINWSAWFAQDRATASAFRAQYDAEAEELQQVETARQQTEEAHWKQTREAENAQLRKICPDLADPKEGPRRVSDLARFLAEVGFEQDQLKWITAAEMSVAYDAMRFRAAQAKAQAQPKPPPAKPLRPSSPAAPSNSLRELEERANRTGSLEDTLALRRARKKAG